MAQALAAAIDSAPRCPLCAAEAKLIFRRCYGEKDWFLARCGCGLHFTHPIPLSDEIAGFYSGNYHRELMGDTPGEEQMRAKFRSYVDWLRRYYTVGRSLDVGCTTGLFPYLMMQSGFEAEGLEINPQTAQWGRETYKVPIGIGTFDDFDAPDGHYDVITMTDVVEHTPRPLHTLCKINRLLRSGGGALISFPDIRAPKSRFYQAVAGLSGRDWLWATCHMPGHIWEFTEPVARRCFAQAGFTVRAFARCEVPAAPLTGKLAPISLGARAFELPWVARRFGSHMQFILEKTQNVASPS